MSLLAKKLTDRQGRATLSHADHCPVNTKEWKDCNCGLFQGYDKPLAHHDGHLESCPCHCTCDFFVQLVGTVGISGIVKTP